MAKGTSAILIGIIFSVIVVGQAHAARICAWIVESNQADDVRKLDLWLQSDADINFLIKVDGDGIVDGSGKSNSPESATYNLTASKAEKVWSFGSTLAPPGLIDETVELHRMPADIFSDAPTPLLAKFAFQRKIPANETAPSVKLSTKQCATVQ